MFEDTEEEDKDIEIEVRDSSGQIKEVILVKNIKSLVESVFSNLLEATNNLINLSKEIAAFADNNAPAFNHFQN
jgi:hypothetical protein